MAKSLRKTTLSCAVATAVHLAIFPGAALAQGTDSADAMVLEEIIVTAQRREQNIQDIPLSVSALSGDTLRDGGVLDISRLKLLVPGMNFGHTGSYAHVAIRGARTEAIQVNTQPIISNYSDGIYRSGTEQFLGPMLDLNRVEVLRGPQGTLFGKNSYGGAIALYTNRPEQEFDAALNYTAGDYGLNNYDGMVNFALGGSASARIVAAHFEHDAYIENIFSGGDDIDDQDADYIRGALLFEFENSSLIVRGEYFDQGGHGSGGFAASLAGEMAGGDVFEVPVPTNNTNSGCGSYSNVDSSLLLPPGSTDYSDGVCPVPDPDDPYTIYTNAPYFLDAYQETFSVEFNADYGWASMKLLAAHTENGNFRSNDGDQGPGTAYIAGENVERETDQVEVHFVDNGQGDVNWLLGVFYLQEDNFDNFYFNSDSRDTQGNQFAFTAITKRTVDSESLAVFGEVTFPVSDSTRLTVGARYSDEDYDWGVNFAGTYYSANIPVDIRDIDLENGEFSFMDPDILISDSFDPITWRIALDHSLSNGSMIYGSVATGYASGGMNSVQDPHTGEFTFDETDSIAYEVGYKATLKDGAMTLNLAAFYNDYKEFTAEPAGVLPTNAVIVYNRVGGDAQAVGIDLEMDWIPAENWLFNLRASVLDTEYGNFVTGLGGHMHTAGGLEETYASVGTVEYPEGDLVLQMRLDGRQIAFSPDFTLGLTASYTMELGAGGTLTPLLQFYYSDDYSASDQGYLHGLQDAYTQSSFRLTWTSSDSRFNISGYVNNIEDEAVIARANVYGGRIATQYYGPPRTYGIRIGYNYR